MKNSVLGFSILLSVLLAGGSNPASAQVRKTCGTDEMMRQSLAEHPEYRQAMHELEVYTQNRLHGNAPMVTTIYDVPVVFHIIHNYGPENISDAQVINAIACMNQDYSHMNSDTVNTVASFAAISANVGFRFHLATIDPNGHCTNGIDRVASLETYVGGETSKLNDWPHSKYLNIWTVATIGSGAAAYSFYPGGTSSASDGIICEYDYVGGIEESDPGKRHTLSHEAGHFFNLKHTWGDSNSPGVNCGDDNVTDTPETEGWTNCQLTNNDICNAGVPENVQNFMDYSYCNTMFTDGQKSRMIAAITASTSSRNNLYTTANLTATGALASPAPLCTPVADFAANYRLVCAGAPTSFTDLSWNGTPNSWLWTFNGGSPATATTSNPSVTYTIPGTYAVSLKAANSSGNNTTTKTAYIVVVDPAIISTTPAVEDFEAPTYPNADWMIVNHDTGPTWKKATTAHTTGLSSMMVSNFTGSTNGQIEELISPLYNFSTSAAHRLTFYVAYAQKTSSSDDLLTVSVSTNCGGSWNTRYSKSGTNLSTAGIKSTAFTPTTASQWRLETVSISPYVNATNLRIKFEFTSCGAGNNIYIDQININGYVGIEEESANADFSLDIYPNPFEGQTMLNLMLNKNEKVSYTITDILGRQIVTSPEQFMESGEHAIPVHFDGHSGLYFLNVRAGSQSTTKKIILE